MRNKNGFKLKFFMIGTGYFKSRTQPHPTLSDCLEHSRLFPIVSNLTRSHLQVFLFNPSNVLQKTNIPTPSTKCIVYLPYRSLYSVSSLNRVWSDSGFVYSLNFEVCFIFCISVLEIDF